ncbi:hypothetical protein T4C_3603, partial [Trichinella pseudospiralis]
LTSHTNIDLFSAKQISLQISYFKPRIANTRALKSVIKHSKANMEDHRNEEPYISNLELEDRQIIQPFTKGYRKECDSNEVRFKKKILKLMQRDIAEIQAKEDSENVLSTKVSSVHLPGGINNPACFDSPNGGLDFIKESISIRADQGDAAIAEQMLSVTSKMGMSRSDALNAVEALKQCLHSTSSRTDSDGVYPMVEDSADCSVQHNKTVNSEVGRCEVLSTSFCSNQGNDATPEGESSGQDGERTDEAAGVDSTHWEVTILKRSKLSGVENPKTSEPESSSGKKGMPCPGKRKGTGQRICVFDNPMLSMRTRLSNSAVATLFYNLPTAREKCTEFASKQQRSNQESNRVQRTTPPRIFVASRLYRKYLGGGSKPLDCFSNVEDFREDKIRPKCTYQAPDDDTYCCGMDAMPFLQYCSFHAHMAKNEFPTIKKRNFSAIERKQSCMEKTVDLNQQPGRCKGSDLNEMKRERLEDYLNSLFSDGSSAEDDDSERYIPPFDVACVDFISEQQLSCADTATDDELSVASETEIDDYSVSETSTSDSVSETSTSDSVSETSTSDSVSETSTSDSVSETSTSDSVSETSEENENQNYH